MDIFTLLDEQHNDVDHVFKWIEHEKPDPLDPDAPHTSEAHHHHFWDPHIPADNL